MGRLRGWRLDVILWRRRWQERMMVNFVWALPKSVVYWAAIRVAAYATTGQYGATDPTDLKVMEMLKRWEDRDDHRPPGVQRLYPGRWHV